MSDCRFGVSPVNYPDPDPDPEQQSRKQNGDAALKTITFFTTYSVVNMVLGTISSKPTKNITKLRI